MTKHKFDIFPVMSTNLYTHVLIDTHFLSNFRSNQTKHYPRRGSPSATHTFKSFTNFTSEIQSLPFTQNPMTPFK
ncbi:hypothetical protein ACE6H2_000474 [Prunus campanulata]